MKPPHAILLVEDNTADVKITQRALKQCGLEVDLIVARDGEEALDYLLRRGQYEHSSNWRRPDLVLLDVNLPRLDGHEVLTRVRSTPEYRTVPVVVLTTSRRPQDVERLYSCGANTYIEKPPEFARFVEVLRTIHQYWLETAVLPAPPA